MAIRDQYVKLEIGVSTELRPQSAITEPVRKAHKKKANGDNRRDDTVIQELTASRKDVRQSEWIGNEAQKVELTNGASCLPTQCAGSIPDQPSAGTQALPVNTVHKTKSKAGRKPTGFDKKSWMREYMRKYRAEKGK